MIASFKSRKDAINYAQSLSERRVPVRIVGTPARVGSGCGLSVQFPRRVAAVAERVLASGEFASFLGFYRG